MERDEAIVAASAIRMRPVLLTTVTTVLGLIPMATGISWDFHPGTFGLQTVSETTQFWRSMAVSVIFGLMVATILTLVIVPVLFSLLDDLRALLGRITEAFFSLLGLMWKRIWGLYWRWVWKVTGLRPQPGEPGYRE